MEPTATFFYVLYAIGAVGFFVPLLYAFALDGYFKRYNYFAYSFELKRDLKKIKASREEQPGLKEPKLGIEHSISEELPPKDISA